MMHDGGGWHWGFGFSHWSLGILFWILIILAVAGLLKYLFSGLK